jgi:hypothetical protein
MYYIYHIPGKKIGCTEQPKQRTSKQGFSKYEILETHTDIYKASEREIELQKQYGYAIDKVPYHISRKFWGSKAGKIGGNTYSTLRNQKCSELGKRTGRRHWEAMLKNRRKYNGSNNPNCFIDEKIAQSILDYYTNLVINSKSNYGLIKKTKDKFSNISKYIVFKICKRETWKHLIPSAP